MFIWSEIQKELRVVSLPADMNDFWMHWRKSSDPQAVRVE